MKARRDPIEVSESVARSIKAEWNNARENRRMTDTFEVDGAMLTFDRLVSVEPMSRRDLEETDEDAFKAQKRDDNAKELSDLVNEYRLERLKRLAMAPYERGMALGIASIVWFAYTGLQSLPDKLISEVRERQMQWFERNPSTTQANPVCYKDLMLPHRIAARDEREVQVRNAASLFVERTLRKDLEYA